MTTLLDTNVVSELMRDEPDRAVVAWLRTVEVAALRTTSMTLAEITYGLQRLPIGRRRERLSRAANEVFAQFPEQVLAFDAAAAHAYGAIVRERELMGRPVGVIDAQIAAVALVHGATIATRNIVDFEGTGPELVDPWS